MRRKTEIILEMEELILYKKVGNLRGICPNCQALVEIRTPKTPEDFSGAVGNQILDLNKNQEIYSIVGEQIPVRRSSFKKWMDLLKNKL